MSDTPNHDGAVCKKKIQSIMQDVSLSKRHSLSQTKLKKREKCLMHNSIRFLCNIYPFFIHHYPIYFFYHLYDVIMLIITRYLRTIYTFFIKTLCYILFYHLYDVTVTRYLCITYTFFQKILCYILFLALTLYAPPCFQLSPKNS